MPTTLKTAPHQVVRRHARRRTSRERVAGSSPTSAAAATRPCASTRRRSTAGPRTSFRLDAEQIADNHGDRCRSR